MHSLCVRLYLPCVIGSGCEQAMHVVRQLLQYVPMSLVAGESELA